jgi:Tfp pilus assembly protein PilZ
MDQYPERRSESRLYHRTPITIEESDICFLYRARLANFSERGLYFETDLLLPPGAKVCIGIHDSSKRFFSEDYVRLIVEIIWRNRLTKVSFNYGYGAKEVLYDELKGQRKDHRKTFSKLVYFASQNKYYEGVIKNLSHSGAFIETRTKFSNGDEIKLVVPGPNKYIQIRCKIIHFNQTGFGVKFKSISKIDKSSETKKTSRQLTM